MDEATQKRLGELYRLRSLGYTYVPPFTPPPPQMQVLPEAMAPLRELALSCHLCHLSKGRKNVAFGEGDENADLMIVGEGPGASEDETGRPFVGRAGALLTKMIENGIGIPRSSVYIANIVKCRPPGNRVPTPEEAQSCLPYLQRQIALVAPKVILALGATSFRYLTGDQRPISKVRGGRFPFQGAVLVPSFHPSFLLRNPSAKKEAYQDILVVKGILGD